MSYLRQLMERASWMPFPTVIAKSRKRVGSISEGIARRELVEFGAMLHAQGFVAGTDGNLSVRLDSNRVLITPTGCSKSRMQTRDMVVVDLSGKKMRGAQNASSEVAMHMAIYHTRPEVRAVVHAHPPTATAFACCGMALEDPLCAEVVMALGSIPLAPYAMTGTPELGESLRAHIQHRDAALLANHGAVTCGETLLQAYLRMETVEHFAKIALAARQIGSQQLLDDFQIGKLMEARRKYLEGCERRG
jgi:L-fuculose-phosphate aldolase